jgi:uncharacterized protein (TIGR02266 family)
MPSNANTLPFPGLPAVAIVRPSSTRRDTQPLAANERRATEPMRPLFGELVSLNEQHTAPPVEEDLAAEAHGVLGRITALRRRRAASETIDALEALDLGRRLTLAQEAPSSPNLKDLAAALADARRVMSRARGTASTTRRAARMRVRARVTLKSPTNLIEGDMEDLSVGGLFLATAHPLPVGTEVELALTLLGEGEVRVQARVAWVRTSAECAPEETSGVGLHFQTIEGGPRAAVLRFIERRAPLRLPPQFTVR